MSEREPTDVEVIQRRLDLVARALAQPAYAQTAEFVVDWARCATQPVPIPEEEP
jgi:hypothetical protein